MRMVLVSLPIVMAVAASGAAQRTPDTRLDTDAPGAAWSEFPHVAATGDSVYAVWQDYRPVGGGILFNRSMDRGATWLTSDVPVGFGTHPRVAASGSSVYVVMGAGNRTYFNRSHDSGATWPSTPIQVNSVDAGSGDRYPEIAVDGSAVYVTWFDSRNGRTDIYFNRSLDGGVTWLPSDVRLDTDAAGSHHSNFPQIGVSGSSVYVIWSESRAGVDPFFRRDVYLNYSHDQGATWQATDRRINDGAGSAIAPRLAVSGNSAYVAWSDSRGAERDIFFNRSHDSGATWLSSDVRIGTDAPGVAGSYAPRIAAAGSSVCVTWADARNCPTAFWGCDIYSNRSTDGGASWLPADVQLDDGAGTATFPKMVRDGADVFVGWPESFARLGFNRSEDDGTTWMPTQVRLDVGGNAPDMLWLATANRHVHAIWHDFRNGDADIYWNVPFGMLRYGSGSGGGAIAPRLDGNGRTVRGSTVAFDLDHAVPGAPATLLVGLHAASRIAVPVLGGTLYVSPVTAFPFTVGGTGTANLPLTIPADPALRGWNANFQVLFLDALAPFGIAMSNGVEAWIG